MTQRQCCKFSTYYLSQEKVEKRAHGVKCARGKRKSRRDGKSQKGRGNRDEMIDGKQATTPTAPLTSDVDGRKHKVQGRTEEDIHTYV